MPDVSRAELAAGIPAAEYLAVQFRLPDASPTTNGTSSAESDEQRRQQNERLRADQRALVAALEAEPGIEGVAVGDVLPRMEHRSRPVEIDNADRSSDAPVRWVRTALMDPDFFRALDQRVLPGRDFLRSDVENAHPVVIVNSAFVLKRSLTQIGVGGLIGVPMAGWLAYTLTGGANAGSSMVNSMLVAVGLATAIVLVVGVCSCLVPTRRVLAVQASEAMRADS